MRLIYGAPGSDQVWRLTRFRADHPDVEVSLRTPGGPWQGVITRTAEMTVITRWQLEDLLDELERCGAR